MIFTVMGLWFGYMMWASAISHNTVLKKSIHEWWTYLSFSLSVGFLFFIRALFRRALKYPFQYHWNAFFGSFCLSFILILNCYDVWVYLFPDRVISYQSEYEVVFPGPARGKTGHCEAGLWIKDRNTDRWKLLCTNREYLRTHRKQGMTGVRVTARVNNVGSYIENYEFIYL